MPLFMLVSILQKQVTIQDLDLDIFGGVVSTGEPLNLKVSNIYLNSDKVSFGFDMVVFCNYPGAPTNAEILFEHN